MLSTFVKRVLVWSSVMGATVAVASVAAWITPALIAFWAVWGDVSGVREGRIGEGLALILRAPLRSPVQLLTIGTMAMQPAFRESRSLKSALTSRLDITAAVTVETRRRIFLRATILKS